MEKTELSFELEKEIINTLIDLAETKYSLKVNSCLPSMLGQFLYEVSQNRQLFTDYQQDYIMVLRSLFTQEVLFVAEAIQFIQSADTNLKVKHDDLIFLSEIMICSGWDLNITRNEQEAFVELLLFLLKSISFNAGIPLEYLLKQKGGLTNHLKFLAYRVLKKEVEKETSDDAIYFYIKENYNQLFNFTNRIRRHITEKYDVDLSNNEVSYLSLQIQRTQLRYINREKA
ncbi:PRD domain-containing protein [Candidatus Enterococcus ferrettii]|uniref:PRD domain-containing protein n=1 Tax=Candidatus Enterococcus ferrettii TaxID=2815324 RepID=A0ABV0ESL2_9ENTE|nr:PRD domain-containing protein [Enterococcus sp. 665A]MBO1343128.1 PRD domain-containing protein [Enterococcus sp. 665A]